MSNEPNLPNEINFADKEYSWRVDQKVNGCLLLAVIISALCDIMFPQVVRHWPTGVRVGIVVVEFLAIALWARAMVRWIRGMDELHRSITTSVVLFATGATFFFMMFWHRLDAAGFFNAFLPKPKAGGSWDICTVGHGFLLLVLFYALGQRIFNRRFK